ncbi:translation initiation factor IF-5A [Candidatus Micrarchaeota archaeon]|nr:translation initiation factor IF-5A [Candidatus Micrarchaeota archaeon]MBU1930607.1 translation initiation factor IF-5A [Candidatus Micrarchaeota archaeon]
MEKKFVKVGQLKEGNYVLVDGFVCQIKATEKSKPGKHGSAKARITAIGVFDGSKRTLLKSTGDEAEVPIIQRSTAQISAVMGDSLSLMDMGSYEIIEAPKPKELSGLKQGDEVEFIRVDENIRVLRKKGSS